MMTNSPGGPAGGFGVAGTVFPPHPCLHPGCKLHSFDRLLGRLMLLKHCGQSAQFEQLKAALEAALGIKLQIKQEGGS